MSDRDAEYVMGDRDAGFAAILWRFATAGVVLTSMLVPLGVLLAAPAIGASRPAVVTVGYVLAEALLLYVGYGALLRVVSPAAREILGST